MATMRKRNCLKEEPKMSVECNLGKSSVDLSDQMIKAGNYKMVQETDNRAFTKYLYCKFNSVIQTSNTEKYCNS